MKKNLTQWLNYLGEIHQTARHLSLDRLQPLVKKLQIKQFNCPVITVGGTNGKGTTVCALEQIYLQAGYRVAAYTSPHLIDFRERLKINNQLLPEEVWCEAFERIESARGDLALSFFECATFAAFLICQATKLDLLILEVGLGGRLDPVNLIENDCAIITSIDLDHLDWLGDTREKIAREKAGIIRKICICGDPQAPEIIENLCREKQAAYYQVMRDFSYEPHENFWVYQGLRISGMKLPRPEIPMRNLACALAATELLGTRLPISAVTIEAALPRMRLAGRFEVLRQEPLIIADVAHNPEAARYLREKIMGLARPGRLFFVFAALKDKLVIEMLEVFQDLLAAWYLADLSDSPRGLSSESLAGLLATVGIPSCYTFQSVEDALVGALEQYEPGDTLVVWGSFHTVALAKQWIAKRS